jgi:hypothetical protein
MGNRTLPLRQIGSSSSSVITCTIAKHLEAITLDYLWWILLTVGCTIRVFISRAQRNVMVPCVRYQGTEQLFLCFFLHLKVSSPHTKLVNCMLKY